MIKFINSWAQGIILAVIIATIIEIIIPEGNNKKYVKTVIGLYILFTIIYPLITKISNNKFNFDSIIAKTSKEVSMYDSKVANSIETNTYIENTYKNNLKEKIKEKIEEKGYTVLDFNLYIETQNEETYGQINSIVLKLQKANKEQNTIKGVNKIEEIDVNIKNNKTENIKKEKELTDSEIKSIKEYLNNMYSIEEERIHINE